MDTPQPITEDTQTPPAPAGNSLAVPISIVVAGALVAFALYARPGAITPPTNQKNNDAAAAAGGLPSGMKPIDANEHILGNPDAQVKIVEYSDLECPFCKVFHKTMHQIIAEYGGDGKVAWVYRHFPLESIHPKARQEAIATECAARLGGNEKFWAYTDRIFDVTPSNNGLDLTLLPQIAADIGLDRASFETCLASGDFDQQITDSFNDAVAVGAEGTPHTLVLTASGKTFPINGAQPYASVKQTIETTLGAE